MGLTELLLNFQSDFLALGILPGIIVRSFTAGVTAGKAVYQKSDGTVDLADATSVATMPSIGIVEAINFPSAGLCTVRHDGDTTTIAGLIIPKIYIVSKSPGILVAEDDIFNPIFPDDLGNVQQQIGQASGPALLFVRISLFRVTIVP